MTELKVKNNALNFRSSPTTADSSNIIGSLTLAQTVELISGDPNIDRFLKVKATIGGTVKEGFASAAFLRPLVSAPKEALISAAAEQWLRFDRSNKSEIDDPQYKIVGEYWQAIGLNLNGFNRDQPWSAAFISFVARKAGYDKFKFDASHSTYVHDAVDKRKAGDASAPFWGFNVGDHKPQLGDLVCRSRGGSQITSMDSLPSGGFISHCDIIFEIKDTEVRTLGGNVEQTVNITSYPLNSSGFLKSGTTRVYGILRNNF
jgi:hypothetical protein